jgi:hypothetical protein
MATDTFTALPMLTQQLVAKDWIERGKLNIMRGTGIATHYNFLLWISEEYDISLEDLLS